ncbi:MAG TPA: hypothetical protein GXZ61_02540 [Clostridiales bacterium]|nr:hypothetical protein [Clostridiales bacterium]
MPAYFFNNNQTLGICCYYYSINGTLNMTGNSNYVQLGIGDMENPLFDSNTYYRSAITTREKFS